MHEKVERQICRRVSQVQRRHSTIEKGEITMIALGFQINVLPNNTYRGYVILSTTSSSRFVFWDIVEVCARRPNLKEVRDYCSGSRIVAWSCSHEALFCVSNFALQSWHWVPTLTKRKQGKLKYLKRTRSSYKSPQSSPSRSCSSFVALLHDTITFEKS